MNMNMKMMTEIRVAVLAVCTMGVSVMPAIAQDTPAPAPAPAGQHGLGGPWGQGRGEERQIEMLTKRLNLTPDQVTQVKAIDDAQRTQAMTLRQDTTMPQEQKHERMLAMRQDTETKIRGVLNEDQKPKYDQMLTRQRERMANHQGGPGGPPPPPAPPSQQ